MIYSIVVAVSLVSGKVEINDTYQTTQGYTLNDALKDCNHNKKMIDHCMLMQNRDKNTLVFTDLNTFQQLVVNK